MYIGHWLKSISHLRIKIVPVIIAVVHLRAGVLIIYGIELLFYFFNIGAAMQHYESAEPGPKPVIVLKRKLHEAECKQAVELQRTVSRRIFYHRRNDQWLLQFL